MDALPALSLSGTPYDRGAKHGATFDEEIKSNVRFYYEYFDANGVDEEAAWNHAQGYLDVVEEEYGTYFEELQGAADGSSVPIEEVTMITMRHTILYSAFATEANADREKASVAAADDCTSYGLEPAITANGHTYIGQNWDWRPRVESVVLDVHREDGPDYVALTEAGNVLGKFGLNEHGIGFAVNGLSTFHDGEHPFRTPSHVRGREILNATRFDEALSPVVDEPRPTSRNYLLGHADGEIIDVETTPDACHYLYAEGGLLTHANHFVTEVEGSRILGPSSLYRANRLRRGLASGGEEIDEATMKAALRDHFSRPHSLCSHVDDSRPEMERGHTNASVIMDLTERRMLATDGPPCGANYHEYRLDAS